MPTDERTPIAQRPQRRPKHLQEALAVHVEYEVTACAEYAQRLALNYARGDRTEEIAYLEALLLHARALHEFLIKPLEKTPRLEDMLRTDFAGREWDPLESENESLRHAATALDKAVPDMHKHLAHLTWARIEDPTQAVWSFVEIARETTIVVAAWARHVEAAKAAEAERVEPQGADESGTLFGVVQGARLLAERAESHAEDLARALGHATLTGDGVAT